MNKKLLHSLLGLFIGLFISLSAMANSLSEWSNNDLCGWTESTSTPKYILDEVDKREILCYGGIEVSTLPEFDSSEGVNGTAFPSPDPSLIPKGWNDNNSDSSDSSDSSDYSY